MRRRVFPALAWLIISPVALAQQPEGRPSRVGVLVIAHGGNNRWNSSVRKAVAKARLDVPVQVAFGMGMHPEEVRVFQESADRLERQGIGKLVVIPLLVSSSSEVYRQYEYLVGRRADAEWPHAGSPLRLEVPVVMGRALDGDPVIADILLERAQALSRSPKEETVLVVAHGPTADDDARQWLGVMEQLAQHVKADGGFRKVIPLLMWDDAPGALKEEANRRLREAVRRESEDGRVLVVPLLLASGGVERKIPKILSGLSYAYKEQTLLPHPKLSQWIADQAAQLLKGE